MPKKLYVSYDKKRTLKNNFYFLIYKEFRKAADSARQILMSPRIIIQGFEQLLKVEQKTPEEQEAQLRAAAQTFLDSLSIEPLWSTDYTYERKTETINIVLTYTSEELPEDFKVELSTNDFLCRAEDTYEPVVLTIHTEGFEQMFGEEVYTDYQVSLQMVYAPCITEFKARLNGVDYEKQLYVNPRYDNPMTLHWNIVGNGRLEHTLKKGNLLIPEAAAVEQIEDSVNSSTVYTLHVDNQKGFWDEAQIQINLTGWHKVGSVDGLDVDGEVKGLAGIVKYKDSFYSYRHPVLYQSQDGCKWVECSKNTDFSQEVYQALACRVYEEECYIMAGNVGGKLKLMKYHFKDKTWENQPAYQYCHSMEGHLAFSKEYRYYGQTIESGMLVTGYSSESPKAQWNEQVFYITVDGKARYSDLCFWQDQFYAAVLCEDGWFYVYECKEKMEDAIFSYEVGQVAQICLLPTTNRLLLVVSGRLFDLENKKELEEYVPPVKEEGVYLGAEKKGIFGIFADENFWVYQ